MRSIAPRWLVAVAIAGAAALLVPALAAGQTAVSDAPASELPATPPGEVTPVTETPAPTDPVAETPATPPAEGPAAGDEVTAPVDELPGEAPAPPPAQTPEGAAPSPGSEATPTPTPVPGDVIELPTAGTLPHTPDLPVPAPTPPGERLAAAVAAPALSIAPAAPDAPAAAGPMAVPSTPDAPAPTKAAAAPKASDIFLTTSLGSVDTTTELAVPEASVPVAPGPGDGFAPNPPSVEIAPTFVAPIGAAPSGSSLLAVLAGYVLPGGGGAPASTIVLLIVLGLILGVTYGAFPQMTERLAAGRLLGASAGHGLAVRRPG
jgi:hypothetical protein